MEGEPGCFVKRSRPGTNASTYQRSTEREKAGAWGGETDTSRTVVIEGEPRLLRLEPERQRVCERERAREKESLCVCVCERERARE